MTETLLTLIKEYGSSCVKVGVLEGRRLEMKYQKRTQEPSYADLLQQVMDEAAKTGLILNQIIAYKEEG